MSRIYVAKRANRIALSLPMEGTNQNPNLLFPILRKTERSELDELVRIELEKQGITSESAVQAIVDEAEKQYEHRIKTQEASKEVRRLMALKANGAKLMQVGHKKWKQAFYR